MNKVLYFEAPSMRELYQEMDKWQKENSRFLSFGIQRDGCNFCCIALAGKREVVICDPENELQVRVSKGGNLDVTTYNSEVVIRDPNGEGKVKVHDDGSLQIWSPYKWNVVICDPNDDCKARVYGFHLQVTPDRV